MGTVLGRTTQRAASVRPAVSSCLLTFRAWDPHGILAPCGTLSKRSKSAAPTAGKRLPLKGRGPTGGHCPAERRDPRLIYDALPFRLAKVTTDGGLVQGGYVYDLDLRIIRYKVDGGPRLADSPRMMYRTVVRATPS